ncbi:MAG: crotonase/enoyl-CoA hydratase family protein [Hyphomicrobium sp.]
MTDDITVSREGAVQVLRFTRPAKKNALTGVMYRALAEAIEEGDDAPEIAAHVIFGSGGVFSAGNDLGDFLATAKGAGGLSGDVLRFVRLLPKIKKPLLAGVDGKAVGIGTTLLFHCDLVYASPESEFATPFLALGLLPEAGSSLLAPRAMGHQRAFELLALGSWFTAAKARESGIVTDVVPSGDVESSVMAAANKLAAKPPEALMLARRLLKGEPTDIRGRIEEEALMFGARLQSPEALEALQAFFEKQTPDFKKPRP